MDNKQNYYNNNQAQPQVQTQPQAQTQTQTYRNPQGYQGGYYNQYNPQYNTQYNPQYNSQYHRIYNNGYYNNAQQGYGNTYGAYNNYNYNYNHQRYNVAPNGYSYYQNLYTMFGGYNPIIDKEFVEISKRGLIAGSLILGIFLMQILSSFFVELVPILNSYYDDITFSMGMGIFMQIGYMLIPALAVFLLSKPEDKIKMNVFNRPKTFPLYLLGSFAGLALCLLGNTVTSFFSVILNIFGVEFFSGAEGMEVPTSAIGIVIFIVNTAVMPALLEEFAFRGVLMQPLRKYGDWFAILISSFCFAIVHANMVQIPFAFIAGISLGYFCIKTKSIWTSVTIHFLNNLLSVLFSVYYEKYPDASIFVYYAASLVFILLGIVAMLVFRIKCPIRMKKDATAMSKNKSLKIGTFITSPTMIISFFFALFMSVSLAETTGFFGLFILFVLLCVAGFLLIRWIRVIQKQKTIKQKPMYTVSMIITILSCLFMSVVVLFTLTI